MENWTPEPFALKPEYSQVEFDPNVRHRMDEINNKLIYRSLVYKEPDVDP